MNTFSEFPADSPIVAANLKAPKVPLALGSKLDPKLVLNDVTVVVSFKGMLGTDSLSVVWTNKDNSSSYETAPQKGDLSGAVGFLIPVKVVAASLSKQFTVHYLVRRGASSPVRSKQLKLSVSALAQEGLDAPVVPQASDSALDLATFEGDATVKVSKWPLIAADQRYWIKVSGTLESGEAYSFYIAQNQIVSASEVDTGLSRVLPRSELDKLKRSSSLTVTFSVTFDGSASETKALVFPPLSLELKISEEFENFSTFPERLNNGDYHDLKFMRVSPGGYNQDYVESVPIDPYGGRILTPYKSRPMNIFLSMYMRYGSRAVSFMFSGTATITVYGAGSEIYTEDFQDALPRVLTINSSGEEIKTIVFATKVNEKTFSVAHLRVTY
ncbi:hypothetical protein D3C77_346620 [compost metagenome]